jgi:ADP-ribosylglycohydrolase
MNPNIKNAILGGFVADAYSLGAHWVYDANQLENLDIDWHELNDPQAMWHKGKKAGDFTHYGDQMLFLLESIITHKPFTPEEAEKYWETKMRTYEGYIDGATRNTLENIDANAPAPRGSSSQDLSICGRVAPLLLLEELDGDFLQHVRAVVAMTHNSTLALDASAYFAQVLLHVTQGQSVRDALTGTLEKFPQFESWVRAGLHSAEQETSETIRQFGPACGIDGGFSGVIHLLSLDDDFETVMIKNAKAGGDSSARGMIVGMILGASGAPLPQRWLQQMRHFKQINTLLSDL